MVDLSERVRDIRELIDAGKYFIINRAHQYGKTTTLNALRIALADEYEVISLDFQGISSIGFQSEGTFVQAFSRLLLNRYEFWDMQVPQKIFSELNRFVQMNPKILRLDDLFLALRRWIVISTKPMVLFIDDVDSAANNQVLLDFLGLLRDAYISRYAEEMPAFQSVVLAGVTDIKHLELKIREEDQHKVNSPWNIAADFNIDMSLSKTGIKGMLDEYEMDHQTGMNTEEIARVIRDITNGYPFLVSRICKLIDVDIRKKMTLSAAWTENGINEAIKMLLNESNTLFQSLTGLLANYPNLKALIRSILMEGETLPYNPFQKDIAQMEMNGIIRNNNGTVQIDNRSFETVLYNLYLSEEELKNNVFSREG